MLNNDCIENKFKELSEDATNEIFGNKLAFTIAIDQDGDFLVYYPYGTDSPIADFKICVQQKTTLRTEDDKAPLILEIAKPKPTDFSDTCNPPDQVTTCNQQIMYFKWPPGIGPGG